METLGRRLDAGRHDHINTETAAPTRTVFHPEPATIRRAIERRSVATLATVSAAGRPHAATVLYQCVDDVLFVSTDRDSRKARNIADHGVAAVTIAVRRLPIGPPASIQFQSAATILANDDPAIVRLAGAGRLDKITAHGELDLADACFLRLPLPCPRRHLRARDVAVAGDAQPARRRRRGRPARQRGVGDPTSRLSRPGPGPRSGPGRALGVWLRRWPGVYDRYCGRHEQPASARWRGARAAGGSA